MQLWPWLVTRQVFGAAVPGRNRQVRFTFLTIDLTDCSSTNEPGSPGVESIEFLIGA